MKGHITYLIIKNRNLLNNKMRYILLVLTLLLLFTYKIDGNIIDAPLRCPIGTRLDQNGNCKEIF